MTQIPLGPGAEFDLIRRFYPDAGTAGAVIPVPDAVRVGSGDDCAVVRGEGIALSMDISVEGIHFLREWLQPEEIGYRAAAAALSDLAAVAATPIGVLASLAIDESEFDLAPRIMEGVRAAAAGARAVLLGGDTSRTTGPMVTDIAVVGNALRPVLRRGARSGDSLWVTGELGAAAAAVRAWKSGGTPEPAARLAFALPTPRTAEAIWLATRGALDALIDVSDGLAGDVEHLAAASGVRIIIDAASVPIHPTVHAHTPDHEHALRLALTGGEDYELCFAAPPGAVERFRDAFIDTFNLPLTCVGTVHSGSGVLLRANGTVTELPYSGHDHFNASS
ncbi:MAG TPA: thiamine-phosphate kinase [Longimicrobiales bacterium]|nr:thiamine-phosphate kinase [Longimicrobiales bacterium]